MDPIITDALTTAGELTRTVAANLRRQNYGAAWDARGNMLALADAMVTDDTGASMLNDRSIIYGIGYMKWAIDAARERQARRSAIADALTNLSRDERIRLIDALADGLSTVAA